MASIKHSTPKVSAYSMYTRNKKVTVVPEGNGVHSKLNTKTKTKDSNLAPSQRKRKVDIAQTVNETRSEERVVRKKRCRKKKTVEEVTPVIESPDSEQELEATIEEIESDEDDAIFTFKPSTSAEVHVSGRLFPACGNDVAETSFRWLLDPVKPKVFFEKEWEKRPFVISRSKSTYYKGLFSANHFERIVKKNYLNYGKEIDIVKYVDGERIPLVNDKKVLPSFLWSTFKEGYSIRMRNPQVYSKALGSLCSLLQEYFSSYVGANMYLTPANSQGFPPHFDDIDAFILQIEGTKHWKLYAPRGEDVLARISSSDLNENEIGEPSMEVELNAGDLLYFPRGYIHQAKTGPGEYSLHITLSTNQLNTWGDFLQDVVNNAFHRAMKNDVEFRKSVPKDMVNYMGHVNSDINSKEREDFQKKGMSLIQKALDYVSFDYAVDTHAIDFIHGSMPPVFNREEKACSVHGNGACFVKGKALLPVALSLNTKIRLIRRRSVVLDVEVDEVRLYHTLCNSQNHKEKDASYIEVDLDHVPALVALFKAFPEYVKIKDLPHKNSELLLACFQQLYDTGFLLTEKPLPIEE